MSNHGKRGQDLELRTGGLLLAIVGGVAVHLLCRLVPMPHRHGATPVEYLLAAFGFLSLSVGAGLVALGRHIFDPVPISARWAEGHVTGARVDAMARDGG